MMPSQCSATAKRLRASSRFLTLLAAALSIQTAEAVVSCEAAIDDLSFGTVVPRSHNYSTTAATGRVLITCSGGTPGQRVPFSVVVGGNQSNAGSANSRLLRSGAEVVEYVITLANEGAGMVMLGTGGRGSMAFRLNLNLASSAAMNAIPGAYIDRLDIELRY